MKPRGKGAGNFLYLHFTNENEEERFGSCASQGPRAFLFLLDRKSTV